MRICSIALVLSAVISTAAAAEGRGVFGFSMTIDSEGFFLNPTLRSIRISKVVPKSPAKTAGMQVGDDVLEVEGRVVAGAKGREIQALADKDVGQALTLKVQHADGRRETLTMVPVEKLDK